MTNSVTTRLDIRIIFRVAAVICGSAAMLVAPGAFASDDLWPFKVGNSWEVEVSTDNTKVAQSVNVLSVTKEADAQVAVLESKCKDTVTQKESYRVNASGIYRILTGKDGLSKIEPGLPIVQYPMEAKKKWMWNGTISNKGQSVVANAVMTTTGPESVLVPAGVFQAYRVHVELALRVGTNRYTYPNDYWFAPGVGMIKQKITQGKLVTETRLTKFTVQQVP